MTKENLIGPADEKIKSLLSQYDPIDAIRSIQQDYGLDLDGIDASYPLLDLCGYSRLEIHLACLDALNNSIIEKINKDSFQLEHFYDIFQRTFPYIHIPYMQPIPMKLLEKFERQIDDGILEQLKGNLAVFENCPLNIKKRIWKDDEHFFQQQMLGMLNDYHHDERLQTLAMNLKPDSYQEVIEERRTHPITLRIIEIIGGDPILYTMFMKMIRLVFEATPYPSLCSLRVDILMSFHDQDVKQITDIDQSRQLIWSLDTCVRNQNMDEAIISKIKECFDDVKNGTPLYGDFAMVLMDPLFSNFLSLCIVRWLRNGVDDDAPPNLEELVNYNAKLLNLAQYAPSAVADNIKIPKLDKDLKGRYWTSVCEVIVNENLSASAVKMEPDTMQFMNEILQKNEVARKVYVQYLIDRTYENDLSTLSRCLPLILSSLPKKSHESVDGMKIMHTYTYKAFLRTFMNIVVKRHLVDCLVDRRWRHAIMDSFLLKVIEWESWAHEQVVWMLVEFYSDSKYLLSLTNEHITILHDWAELCILKGKRSEKDNKNFFEIYSTLLLRSTQILDGRYQIRPANVLKFCTEMEEPSSQ
ncbi:cofactor of BRCA1-domain-containing protein [Cunninghamella echinulata]|nr:cofactor of BRCA1-domain-containing protein [Cunninghamella echinulata]